jgi:hypothetical protein
MAYNFLTYLSWGGGGAENNKYFFCESPMKYPILQMMKNKGIEN